MLSEYTQYLFAIYGDNDFFELAIEKLLSMLPEELQSREFAINLLRIMEKELITLPNGITVNTLLHVVCKNNKQVELTPNETRIVELLAKSNGVVSQEYIINKIWGYAEDNNILKVNISNIRRKIDLPIYNVKGKGYTIQRNQNGVML